MSVGRDNPARFHDPSGAPAQDAATDAAIAAKAATASIPIEFTIPEDPAALGLVESLARPSGNITGINFFIGELMSKRLELLREMVPAMTRVAVFVNSANPVRAEAQVKEAESAGMAMGPQIQIFKVATPGEIHNVRERAP